MLVIESGTPMRVYATSRQVHSALSKILRTWFLSYGWAKRQGGSCAFTRPSPAKDGYWCFWVQVSQWGSADFGNEFSINLVPQKTQETGLCGAQHARVLQTLSAEDRELGLRTETEIVARIPKPPPERKIYEWMRQDDKYGEGLRQAWVRAYKPDPARWQPDFDVWLRYFAVDDVQCWGDFLLPRLGMLTIQAEKSAA
jgi:hypothetical protein